MADQVDGAERHGIEVERVGRGELPESPAVGAERGVPGRREAGSVVGCGDRRFAVHRDHHLYPAAFSRGGLADVDQEPVVDELRDGRQGGLDLRGAGQGPGQQRVVRLLRRRKRHLRRRSARPHPLVSQPAARQNSHHHLEHGGHRPGQGHLIQAPRLHRAVSPQRSTNWTANASGFDTASATIPATGEDDLPTNDTFQVKVKATNTAGDSPWSAAVDVTCGKPGPVTGLKCTAAGDDSLTVTWDGSAGAKSFEVQSTGFVSVGLLDVSWEAGGACRAVTRPSASTPILSTRRPGDICTSWGSGA